MASGCASGRVRSPTSARCCQPAEQAYRAPDRLLVQQLMRSSEGGRTMSEGWGDISAQCPFCRAQLMPGTVGACPLCGRQLPNLAGDVGNSEPIGSGIAPGSAQQATADHAGWATSPTPFDPKSGPDQYGAAQQPAFTNAAFPPQPPAGGPYRAATQPPPDWAASQRQPGAWNASQTPVFPQAAPGYPAPWPEQPDWLREIGRAHV